MKKSQKKLFFLCMVLSVALLGYAAALENNDICSECKGTKVIDCPQCEDGTVIQQVVCYSDKIKVTYICSSCNTTQDGATTTCKVCKGTVTKVEKTEKCKETKPQKITCPVCKGKKTIPCDACK